MDKPPLLPVTTLLFSLTFAAAAVLVPWYGFVHGYEWQEWLMAAVVFMCNGTAITAGYHRLWAHKTYKAHWSLRLWFALWGAMTVQNSVLHWTSGHRRHHRHVDDYELDPYSASRGFWFSHIGWMLRPYDPRSSDFSGVEDLQQDKIVVWQHRYYVPLVLLMNLGLPAFLGYLYGDVVAALLLSGVLRLVVSHHCTFFINSLAHIWGRRPYTDRNSARDNDFLALLTWGEGYHNFHHIFQSDYRNGIRWWQYDPTKWIIFTAAKLKLASGLKRVSEFRIQKALVDMQYKQADEKLTCEKAKARLEEQYQTMVALLREWSALHHHKLESRANELKEQWLHSEAHTRYLEMRRIFQEQKQVWQLVRSGQAA